MKKTVKMVCGACCGSGLYEGMCEPKGFPVVCLQCNGTGCAEMTYEPFVQRKVIRGVKGVSLSKGRFILSGVGSSGDVVSYQEFLGGKLKYNRN